MRVVQHRGTNAAVSRRLTGCDRSYPRQRDRRLEYATVAESDHNDTSAGASNRQPL